MTITKLKAKNQITIPSAIVKRLHLKMDELFAVDIEDNYIKLIPVKVEPRYTAEELKAIDRIVKKEKSKGKVFKSGKEFSAYIKKLTKKSFLFVIVTLGMITCIFKQPLYADLTQDIEDANTVMWIGAHPDDELFVSGLLAKASLLEAKETYVVSLMRDPKIMHCNERSSELLGLKDYITYDSGRIGGFFGFGPTIRIMSERIKELLLKIRPSLIVTFEPTNGFRSIKQHMMASRIVSDALKKSAIKANLYYVINRDENFAKFLGGAMDPLPYTDVIELNDVYKKIGKSLWDIKMELCEIYSPYVPKAKELVASKELQNRFLHKEFYRKVE